MRKETFVLFLWLLVYFPFSSAWANSLLLDFETGPDATPLFDQEPITTQFPGLMFSGALILTSDDNFDLNGPCSGGTGSLFAALTPPNSGCNVLAPDELGGTIEIDFEVPIKSASMFVTYTNNSEFEGSDTPLIISAFDSTNALISTTSSTSPFFANYDGTVFKECQIYTNCSPNELVGIVSSHEIVRLKIGFEISGKAYEQDFVLDDLSFTPVPEPSSALLWLSGIIGLLRWRNFIDHLIRKSCIG